MITNEQLTDVVGATAYDRSGDKVGKVGNVYYDDDTDEPKWLTVRTGLFGGNETFVPVQGAELGGDGRLTVAYDKAMIKDAPNVDEDGHLSPEEEQQLYRYYSLDAGGGGVGPAGRTGTDQASDYSYSERPDTDRTGTGRADGDRSSAYSYSDRLDTDRTDTDRTDTDRTDADQASAYSYSDRPDDGRADGGRESGGRLPARGENREGAVDDDRGVVGRDTSGPTTDDAMTRSEEQLRVGTETRETGRARLRKRVVTERQETTVPVSHEEATLEREAITDANRGDAYDGPAISEEEHEVTLSAERPVVDTETVAVERVTMGKQTVTEQETVGGDVRKERIDMDDDAARTDRTTTDRTTDRTDRTDRTGRR